jgi:hypothetical protein
LGLSSNAPNFEKTLNVAINQGGTAEAAIDGISESIDSIINRAIFFIAKWPS